MKKLHILTPATMLAFATVAAAQTPPNVYRVVNLVSNTSGVAAVTDPNLVDPWGISASAGSPFWISDHGNGLSTLYNGAGAITATVVKIPAAGSGTVGKPTGQIQNSGGAAFTLANGNAASFIFSDEDGLITAWNTGTVAEVKVDNSAQGAVYKGLAIGTSAAGATLYGANFSSGKIDTWGPGFKAVTLSGNFVDTSVPAGYAPFNIQNLGGKLYVEYAKQNAAKTLDVAGAGNGYVAVFDQDGNLVIHLVSGGALNSPWGVAIAPATWGAFGGALIVGNFGDGRLNAYSLSTGAFLGALQDSSGTPLAISGLWGLLFGGNGTRSDANTLYFVAGMPNGSTVARGLLGSIAPPSNILAVVNAASWLSGPVAAGELISIGGQTVGAIPQVVNPIPAAGNSLPTTTSNVSVSINNVPAPIIYTNGSETSVQVPNSLFLFSSQANIVVTTPGQTSSITVPMATAAPGLFTTNSAGSGQLVAFNQDGTLNSATNAAAAGTNVTFFATGLGATAPPAVDGAIEAGVPAVPFATVTAKIGGQTATVVSASTTVGRLSGLTDVKVTIPSGLTAGAQSVVLTANGVATTQTVTIATK